MESKNSKVAELFLHKFQLLIPMLLIMKTFTKVHNQNKRI